MPENRAHEREQNEMSRSQGERAFHSAGAKPAAADHNHHGQWSEDTGVHATHVDALGCRQACRISASLNHAGAPV
jgi:hypothetical protein